MNDEKMKRMKALMDELMSEMTDEICDEQTLTLLEKNLRKEISRVGLKYNVSSVKLFFAGFEMSLAAFSSMGPQGAVPLLMGMKKIIKMLDAPNLAAVEDALKRTKNKPNES